MSEELKPAVGSAEPLSVTLNQDPSAGGTMDWVIGIDPSEKRAGFGVVHKGKPVFAIDACPWDPKQVVELQTALKLALGSYPFDASKVQVVCEVIVGGPATAFSSTSVNRSAGMCVAHVIACFPEARSYKDNVGWIVPASWRKRAFGKAYRGVSREVWKAAAVSGCKACFGMDLKEDAAEALIIAMAYKDGYVKPQKVLKKKKQEEVKNEALPANSESIK